MAVRGDDHPATAEPACEDLELELELDLELELRLPERYVPRYLPAAQFPPYRYVPGHSPHPTRDPAGHSYQRDRRESSPASWAASDWQTIPQWLHGVDLFNAFFFWEAHEEWEELWRVRSRNCPAALLLQGLIQLAAALLKVHLHSPGSAARLASAGMAKLDQVARVEPRLLGLDVVDTRRLFGKFFDPLAKRNLPALDASVPVLLLAGRA